MDIAMQSDRITEEVFGIFGGRVIESALHGRLPMPLSVAYKTVVRLSRSLKAPS